MLMIFCCFGWKFCYGFFPPARPNRLQCKIPPIQQSTDDSWRTEKVFAMEAASAGLVRARWPQNDWVGTCRSIACMVQPCRCKSHICMRLNDLHQITNLPVVECTNNKICLTIRNSSYCSCGCSVFEYGSPVILKIAKSYNQTIWWT